MSSGFPITCAKIVDIRKLLCEYSWKYLCILSLYGLILNSLCAVMWQIKLLINKGAVLSVRNRKIVHCTYEGVTLWLLLCEDGLYIYIFYIYIRLNPWDRPPSIQNFHHPGSQEKHGPLIGHGVLSW